jgi:hypothetical protein
LITGVEGPDGGQLAMVMKALIEPARERWQVKIKVGQVQEVTGNL